MNWKRGLLRLWLVLTVAWVGLCAFVFDVPTLWHNATAPIIIKAGNYELEFPLDSTRAEIITAISGFVSEERAKGYNPVMGSANDEPSKVAEDVVGKYDRISLPVRLWRVFLPLLLTALLPPIAALMSGYACAFVVRGFRFEPTPKV
ncbi:hypothetical protein MKK69_19485 [Methylobacterium sp. J-026]|uniref:hypothetical protein n=1 Tax=Methylobacterium sp. J-026 TaxID=2836624 RepID=UPI001FBA59E7|nr:hypothetical protein [Methylobacterium sp. J-026]MCJ2136207.1 hypothetical protein [Methylobacterium sp. J-026]